MEASFVEASLAEFAGLVTDPQVNIQRWDALQDAYEKDETLTRSTPPMQTTRASAPEAAQNGFGLHQPE